MFESVIPIETFGDREQLIAYICEFSKENVFAISIRSSREKSVHIV